jgi:hypothetical protein
LPCTPRTDVRDASSHQDGVVLLPCTPRTGVHDASACQDGVVLLPCTPRMDVHDASTPQKSGGLSRCTSRTGGHGASAHEDGVVLLPWAPRTGVRDASTYQVGVGLLPRSLSTPILVQGARMSRLYAAAPMPNTRSGISKPSGSVPTRRSRNRSQCGRFATPFLTDRPRLGTNVCIGDYSVCQGIIYIL